MTTKNLGCVECTVGHLVPSVYSDNFEHAGASVQVDGLECYICDACGADPIFSDQIRRNQLRIADAKRAADGRLIGAEVRTVRQVLGLTQQDASSLFGGGANAFSKYERGDTLQSEAMDCLLRLMGRHPYLLKELEGYMPVGHSLTEVAAISWQDMGELEISGDPYSHIHQETTVIEGGYTECHWQRAA